MSDDTPPSGFNWGLRPGGGEPEKPTEPAKPAPEPDGDEKPVDLGFISAVSQGEVAPPVPNPVLDDDEGEPTAAFDFRAPAPPPVDPIVPPVYHEGRTLPWEAPPAFDPALEGATEALSTGELGLVTPAGESAPTSAIDSLFADEKFQEYEDAPAQALVPFVSRDLVPTAAPESPAARPPKPPKAPRAPHGPLPKSQKILIWVAGGLVAALALAGLFFVGTRIGDAAPTAVATSAATPTPEATEPAEEPAAPVVTIGPVAPGVVAWNGLLGTECLEPYVSAWEDEFTVVDCATPHGGQMVYRGRFDDSAIDPFPGLDVLQARMNLLCASPENIDYAAASQFADIQVAASYAGTEEEWATGDRNYYCFVNRSSGEPLTISVAMPARAPVVIPVVPALEP